MKIEEIYSRHSRPHFDDWQVEQGKKHPGHFKRLQSHRSVWSNRRIPDLSYNGLLALEIINESVVFHRFRTTYLGLSCVEDWRVLTRLGGTFATFTRFFGPGLAKPRSCKARSYDQTKEMREECDVFALLFVFVVELHQARKVPVVTKKKMMKLNTIHCLHWSEEDANDALVPYYSMEICLI